MSPKRSFYEDDELTINKPGFNYEISSELKEEESSHGNISFVKGMGIRTTPHLEIYFSKFRHYLYDKVSIYETELGTQKSAVLNEINSISSEFNSIVAEPILPNLIYILTSSLTGSILVRRRSLPIRFISPVLFGGLSFCYFMPNSFNNLAYKLDRIESVNFPEVHQMRNDVHTNYNSYKSKLNDLVNDSKLQLEKSIHDARVYLLDLFK